MAFGGLVVFKNISLDIIKHQIVALIGPNGAGKTTLINCITGVYKPTQGDILFQDRTISGMRPHQICRAGIGRTYQIPRPFMNMSVFENLQVCAKPGQVDFRALLDLAGLWDKRSRLASFRARARRFVPVGSSSGTKELEGWAPWTCAGVGGEEAKGGFHRVPREAMSPLRLSECQLGPVTKRRVSNVS